jgi:Raf kinase inhibitor-like YbhB/YbcL family protein
MIRRSITNSQHRIRGQTMKQWKVLGIMVMLAGIGLVSAMAFAPRKMEVHAMSLTLTSSAFRHNGEIPARYTCDGGNVSPPLSWSGVPGGAKSLVLIVDDPDAPDPKAPKMTWVHWVLYNIPPNATGLAEGLAPKDLPKGTLEGSNDWKRTGYGGPCPPIGRHRYFHKLYALDTVLPDLGHPTKAAVERAIQGHTIAQVELIGGYARMR